jgi:4,5-dihydroxyphthalate decarboxylase
MQLPISTMRYDITVPLLDGRVQIPDVELVPTRTGAMVFANVPALQSGDFGLWDLNMGYVLPAIEAGWDLIGLPLFIKRKPIYTFLFCRVDAGINSPKDLEGKRIGAASYPTSITIWAQGLLQYRHGVDISKLVWSVTNDKRAFPLHTSTPTVEAAAGEAKSPIDRLMAGEVDAIITDISDGKIYDMLEKSPDVKRLFPNYMEEDLKVYQETGLHAPMHQMVMSTKLDKEHPDLARQVVDAFEEAKQVSYMDTLNDRAGFSVMYQRERFVEQEKAWGDPWTYGVKNDRGTIDAFLAYNAEQGFTSKQLSIGDWLAESSLDT